MCASIPTITGRRTFTLWLLIFQVLVRISDLMVIADEARPAQIAEVIAWAHRESLALKWAELNERG